MTTKLIIIKLSFVIIIKDDKKQSFQTLVISLMCTKFNKAGEKEIEREREGGREREMGWG